MERSAKCLRFRSKTKYKFPSVIAHTFAQPIESCGTGNRHVARSVAIASEGHALCITAARSRLRNVFCCDMDAFWNIQKAGKKRVRF
jgi:hypothetical protein